MTAAIRVRDLRKRFGDIIAVEDASFEAARATVLALLGPNGAGKTTITRVLATILAPDGGTAENRPTRGSAAARSRWPVRGGGPRAHRTGERRRQQLGRGGTGDRVSPRAPVRVASPLAVSGTARRPDLSDARRLARAAVAVLNPRPPPQDAHRYAGIAR